VTLRFLLPKKIAYFFFLATFFFATFFFATFFLAFFTAMPITSFVPTRAHPRGELADLALCPGAASTHEVSSRRRLHPPANEVAGTVPRFSSLFEDLRAHLAQLRTYVE
jgi:hypothetical protein